MKLLTIILSIINLIIICVLLLNNYYYPSGNSERLKPDENGIIHHPKYGDYPVKNNGGNFYPGQEMTLSFNISDE